MKVSRSNDVPKNFSKLIEFSDLKNLMNSTNCPKGLTQKQIVVFDPGYSLHVGRPSLIQNTFTGKTYYLVTTFTTKNPICPKTNKKLVDYYTNVNNTKSTFLKICSYENK